MYQAWIDSNGQMLIPHGESGADFRARCCEAYEKCIAEAREKDLEKIAIVCHGGTIMSVNGCVMDCRKNLFYEWQGCQWMWDFNRDNRRRGKWLWYSGN